MYSLHTQGGRESQVSQSIYRLVLCRLFHPEDGSNPFCRTIRRRTQEHGTRHTLLFQSGFRKLHSSGKLAETTVPRQLVQHSCEDNIKTDIPTTWTGSNSQHVLCKPALRTSAVALDQLSHYQVSNNGRAIVQAVSLRLPTATARVRAHFRSCGICGEQSGTGAGFHRVLGLPLPILFPPTAPHSWGGYNRPVSGRRTKWPRPHPTPRN
jgi:hypothetical protein